MSKSILLAALVAMLRSATFGFAAEPSAFQPATRPLTAIISGDPWTDNRGKEIQAHGGGILQTGDTYYWFGEDRSRDNQRSLRYVACYSSKDLMNWTFRRQVLKQPDPENLGRNWRIERPKVYFNARTSKYVMYVHLDGGASGYSYAHVGVFTCDTVDGAYRYVHSFRPLGLESRDIGQFVDDDGSAYLIFESRPSHGFYIAALSDDYLTVTKKTCFLKAPLEGGALIHYQGLYYVIGSLMTGWAPNPNKYATAKTLEGPWSEFKDLAPPAAKTYQSQSTFVLKVIGTRKTNIIFCGDQWKPRALWDSRYLWMPLEIGDGKLWLPEPRPWSIDVKTGVVTLKW